MIDGALRDTVDEMSVRLKLTAASMTAVEDLQPSLHASGQSRAQGANADWIVDDGRLQARMLPVALWLLAERDDYQRRYARCRDSCMAGQGMNIRTSDRRIEKSTLYPLTSVQEMVWLEQVGYERIPLYNVGAVLQVQGSINPRALADAVNVVANAHEALRIVLVKDGDETRQRVLPSVVVPLQTTDVSMANDPTCTAQKYMQDEFSRPFDFGSLLWKVELIRVEDRRWFVLHRYHHLIIDGVGVSLHGRAIVTAYQSIMRGERPQVAASAYTEYVREDADYLVSKFYQKDADFWREKFTAVPQSVFRTIATGGLIAPQVSGQVSWRIDRSRFEGIRAVCKERGTSPMHFMLALVAAYFGRVSDAKEVVIGVAVHNRVRPWHRKAIGMFSSSLPVAVPVDAAIDFERLTKIVAAELRRCYRHQRYPIAQINRELKVAQHMRTQLFDISLTYAEFETDVSNDELRFHVQPMHSGFTQTPLAFYIRDYHQGDDVYVDCTYNTAVLDEEEVERIVERLQCMLDTAWHDPATRVARLPLLSYKQREQVLTQSVAPACEVPSKTWHELFESQADKTPDAIACSMGEQAITYATLNARANRLAHRLRAAELKLEDRVAVLLDGSCEVLIAIIGVLKAGGCYLLLDPRQPADRLELLMQDAAVTHVITVSCWRAFESQSRRLLLITEWTHEFTNSQEDNPSPLQIGLTSEHLAYVIYTSGSTGDPKGVMISHRALVNYCLDAVQRFGIEAGRGSLVCTPLTFDLALTGLLPPLLCGRAVRLAPHDDPAIWAQELRRGRDLAPVKLTPSHVQLLLEAESTEGVDHSFDGVRALVCGGEALHAESARAFRERFRAATIFNHYGPTETTVGCIVHELVDQDENNVPIGRPIANSRAYILDANQELLPPGAVGELYIGGPGVARGYLRRPGLTAQRFFPDPFTTGKGASMYRTGDLARITANGVIEYLGRNDDQVKVRGYRIELGEIEAALKCHPLVLEAAAIAREVAPGDIRIQVYVTERRTITDVNDIHEHLVRVLPHYMAPSAIFVLERLPLTKNGKIDRAALLHAEQNVRSHERETPVGAAEETLAKLWCELLKLDAVGRNESFFRVGGHSLLAVQLVSRIRAVTGRHVTPRDIVENPTIASLALRLEQYGVCDDKAIARADRCNPLPLSSAQQRLWFLSRLPELASAYHVPGALHLLGPLDVDALQRALDTIVSRHESLRTVFAMNDDGTPAQVIIADRAFELKVISCPDIIAWEEFLRKNACEEAAAPFNLEVGPPIRGRLLKINAMEWVLLVTLHHIVSDGWSLSILTSELSNLYAAFAANATASLRDLPIQYPDYAVWQRRLADTGSLERDLQFWRRYLDGAPESLSIPTEKPRPANSSYAGGTAEILIAEPTITALRAVADRSDCTLFAALFAIVTIVLSKWAGGQKDVVVGTVVAGRDRPELEPLIGCFINFVPLRSRVDPTASFADYLRQTSRSVLEALEHQHCPFESIVAALNPHRAISANPLFNVAFLLQNYAKREIQLDGLMIRELRPVQRTASLDLRFVAEEVDSGLRLQCEYRTDLFEHTTVAALLGACAAVAQLVVADPGTQCMAVTVAAPLAPCNAEAIEGNSQRHVVIGATFTAEGLVEPLQFWMDLLGIDAKVSSAPYGQLLQQLLDHHSAFAHTADGCNVLMLRAEDVWRDLPRSIEPAEKLRRLEAQLSELLDAIGAFRRSHSTQLIVCLCPESESWKSSFSVAVAKLYATFVAGVQSISDTHLLTDGDVSQHYKVSDYFDTEADKLAHVPYTPEYTVAFATILARRMRSLFSAPFKVVAVDCDNTLWDGLCGEVGPSGVRITDGHRILQEFLRGLHMKGVLLCLCSKNNEEDVIRVLSDNPNMVLRQEHFAAVKLNWLPKSENLRLLAQELNLGLDSFVFLDDSATECAEVSARASDVTVLHVPDNAAEFDSFCRSIWAFDFLKTSQDSDQRVKQYRQNRQRQQARARSVTFEEFLTSLQLQVHATVLTSAHLDRAVELIMRTNQFNLTTKRRTRAQLEQELRQGLQALVVHVSDRFGDYGLVGLLFYEIRESSLVVDSFLLSCRVLGRGVEHEVVRTLANLAAEAGLERIELRYIPTGKNQPAMIFLESTVGEFATKDGEHTRYIVPLASAACIQARSVSSTDMTETGADQWQVSAAGTQYSGRAALAKIVARLRTIADIRREMQTRRPRTILAERPPHVSPRTTTERLLAEVWSEMLQVQQVGIKDSFFALGGHSLQGIQLIARLRSTLLADIPLVSLFESRDLEELASMIDHSVQAVHGAQKAHEAGGERVRITL